MSCINLVFIYHVVFYYISLFYFWYYFLGLRPIGPFTNLRPQQQVKPSPLIGHEVGPKVQAQQRMAQHQLLAYCSRMAQLRFYPQAPVQLAHARPRRQQQSNPHAQQVLSL